MLGLILLSVVVVIILGVINMIAWSLPALIFYPNRLLRWKPSSPYDNLLLNTVQPYDVQINQSIKKEVVRTGIYIHAWHLNNFPGAKTILFCHGTSGNISYRAYIIRTCETLKLNLLLFDYRGYGISDGLPSKANIKRDGELAYLYLRQTCPPEDIIIWGESLGGHIASHLASKYECFAVILMCTFSSVPDILSFKHNLGWTGQAIHTLMTALTDTMPNYVCMRKIKCPIVILHSRADKLIPFQCAMKLYQEIPHGHKKLIEIGGDHSSPEFTSDQLCQMFDFLKIPLDRDMFCSKFDIQKMLSDIQNMVDSCIHD